MTATARAQLRHVLSALAEVADAADRPRVDELLRRLEADVFRVLVAGEAKRGKSTLINALLGQEVLPTGVVPLTAIPTTVAHGPVPELLLTLAHRRREARPLTELADYVTEAGNPRNRRGVSTVEVRLPAPLLAAGIELVDTPGTGSVHDHNTVQAHTARERMDAAIVVLAADPPVSAAERALLAELQADTVALFCLLNKADYLDPGELTQARAFTETVVTAAVGRPLAVHPVSARRALAARVDGDRTALEASGLAAFEAEFLDFLDVQRDQALLTSLAGQASRVAKAAIERHTAALHALALDDERLATTIAAFEARIADVVQQRRDGHALAAAEIRRLVATTTDAAQTLTAGNAPRILAGLDAVLDDPAGRGLAEVESAALAAAADRIQHVVDRWREAQAARLDEAVGALDRRLSERLGGLIHGVRAAAAELFDLDLADLPPPARLVAASRFSYQFFDDPGNVTALAAVVRTHLPGRWGRRRVADYLAQRIPELLDQQAGRARADFQTRLTETGRQLHAELDRRYDEGAGQLVTALRQAGELAAGQATARTQARRQLSDRTHTLVAIAADADTIRGAAPAAAGVR